MKKHLWLLAFCSTAQAGQVLLEQVEYQHFQSAEKTVFSQHYLTVGRYKEYGLFSHYFFGCITVFCI